MKFKIKISKTAIKQLNSLGKEISDSIKKHLKELKKGPFQKRALADIKKLKNFQNPDLYRLRVGDYRAIYTVSENVVKVTKIFHRSKGYDWLN